MRSCEPGLGRLALKTGVLAWPSTLKSKGEVHMKRLKIAGLCLVSIFVMGMAASTPALANWEGCLPGGAEPPTKYESSQCIKAKPTGSWEWKETSTADLIRVVYFTIELKDKGTPLQSTSVICTAGGEGEGSVGPGESGKITEAKVKAPATNCKGTGDCEASGITEVSGIHLPWRTKLSRNSGKVLDTIENSGAGEPGWKIVCKSILGKTETDECESEGASKLEQVSFINELSNGGTEQLVLHIFSKAHKSKCSIGGAEEGEIEGLGAILLKSGSGLRVS